MPEKSTSEKFLDELERLAELLLENRSGVDVRIDRDNRGSCPTLIIRASELVSTSRVKKTVNGKKVAR